MQTPIEIGNALPWTSKATQWNRWSASFAQGGKLSESNLPQKPSEPPTPTNVLTERLSHALKKSIRTKQFVSGNVREEEIDHSTLATLGQILYPAYGKHQAAR